MHTIPVITQKLYFETGIPQTLLISERGRRSSIAFITTILQMYFRKNVTEIFSFIGACSSVKRKKKSQKAKGIFKANKLEIRPIG